MLDPMLQLAGAITLIDQQLEQAQSLFVMAATTEGVGWFDLRAVGDGLPIIVFYSGFFCW